MKILPDTRKLVVTPKCNRHAKLKQHVYCKHNLENYTFAERYYTYINNNLMTIMM